MNFLCPITNQGKDLPKHTMDNPTHITHFTQTHDTQGASAGGFGTLFSMVYSDLEHLARGLMKHECPGHTLGTHGLMHEAYARLLATYQRTHKLETMDQADLRSLTAVVMRRVLVDHARKRNARTRANDAYAQCIEQSCQQVSGLTIDLISLEEALAELETIDPRKARIVELRFFGALPMTKIATMIDCPLRTVERDWSFARAWLCDHVISNTPIQGKHA